MVQAANKRVLPESAVRQLDAGQHFSASVGGGDNEIAFTIDASFTTVPLAAVAYDTASGFSTGDKTWTVPVTGVYSIDAALRPADGAPAGRNIGVGVGIVNADSPSFAWSILGTRSGVARQSLILARHALFNVGDKVRLFAYSDGGATQFNGASLSLSLVGTL